MNTSDKIGFYCARHNQYAVDGVCPWCEPAPSAPPVRLHVCDTWHFDCTGMLAASGQPFLCTSLDCFATAVLVCKLCGVGRCANHRSDRIKHSPRCRPCKNCPIELSR